MNTLSEKVAIITGGGSGIGRASAVALAKAGAKVVVAGRREAELDGTIAEVKAAGGEGFAVKTDVLYEDQIQNLIDKTVEAYGKVDILFSNAGVEGDIGPLHEQTAENYHFINDINVKGVFLSMKRVIQQFLKQGAGGSIINNASVAGMVGFPGATNYVASKHAVIGLTRSTALEYATAGIRVNAVSPGAIQTDMIDRFKEFVTEEQLISFHPLGRLGKAEEIADAVVFLAGDTASFITGVNLPVDGGFTAR